MESDSAMNPFLERHLKGHTKTITRVRFNPIHDAEQMVTSSNDGTVILWDLKNLNSRDIRFSAHDGFVKSVCWSPKGRIFATASVGTIKLWEAKVRGISHPFVAHPNSGINCIDFDYTGTMVVSASDDKSIKLWRVAHKKFLTSFTGNTNWVRSAKFSPDGRLIASCGDDKVIRVFDVKSGNCIRSFREEKGMGRQVCFHPDGNLIAVALTCNRVKIFNIAQSELIQLYEVHCAPINDIAFHPSGNFMVTGSEDGTIKILDLLEGRPIFTLTGHTGKVCGVDFSKLGTRIASVGTDRQVLIWKSNLHNFNNETFDKEQSIGLSSEHNCTVAPSNSKSHFDDENSSDSSNSKNYSEVESKHTEHESPEQMFLNDSSEY